MKRGTAAGLLWAACALSSGGCADEDVQGAPADVEPVALAQTTPSVGSAPTAQEVLLQTRERRNIRIVGNFGSGCEAKLVPAAGAEKRGLLQVYFESYRLRFPAGNMTTFDSRGCSVLLKVSGAGGYRFSIFSVLYVGGYAMLTPGAEARFGSTVWWSGRQPLTNQSEPWSVTVPTKADSAWVPSQQWTHNQEFVQQADRVSDCLDSDEDWDQVTIDTWLMLDNKDGRYDAELDLTSLSGQASVVVDLEPQKCK